MHAMNKSQRIIMMIALQQNKQAEGELFTMQMGF